MSTGILTGTYKRPDGTARTGTVTITPSVAVVRNSAGNVILAGPVSADLDASGSFTVTLAASNDSALDPAGVTYKVTGHGALRGIPAVAGIAIPAGQTIDMADVTPVDPAAPTYAPWVYGTGGGGGGGGSGTVTSVNGNAGPAVVLTAANVGADALGAATSAVTAHIAATDPHGDRAYTTAQISALVNGAPGILDTLGEIAAQLATDESAVAALTTAVNAKLSKSANLSDLTNVAAAKANLGLGSVMVVDNGDGTQTITVDDGGVFTLVDNNNGTGTLTLAGIAATVGGVGPAGKGISSVARTAGTGAAGSTDTYTITYSDASTSTFTVVNGSNGSNGSNGRGITSIARTSGSGAAGTTDTYTITYSDASTSTFTVYNGANGSGGAVSVETVTAPPNTNTTGSVLGVSANAARADHTHAIGAHDHTTTAKGGQVPVAGLSATGTADSTTYLRGDGAWATPAGGGSSLTVQDEGGALTTAATAINFVGLGVTASGTGATKTVTINDDRGLELPDNVVATTIPRYSCTTAAAVGSTGQMKLSLIRLYAGQTVTSIRIIAASTAGATLTHAIAGLYDSTQTGPVLLATSADDTTATWTANTARTFTMTTPYVVTTTGWYYIGFMVAGTTLPTIFLQSALAGTAINAGAPVAAAVTNSGLTTALPSTSSSAATGVNAQRFYAEVL